MIVSLDIVHELLTTIYSKIFTRRREEINKYDVLLYLDDYYYFDILQNVSNDIKELDNDFEIIETDNDNFNDIFDTICKNRNYVIFTKHYSTVNEKRIDFLHELLTDLLCLLYTKRNKKIRVIEKIYKYENNIWNTIENYLKDISNMINNNINKENSTTITTDTITITDNTSTILNKETIEETILDLENINKEHFKNKDIIISKHIDENTETVLNNLIQIYNNEYESRFYYLFLNYYLTIQTMFLSPIIELYSEEVKKIISQIVQIKKQQYQPLTLYNILAFQYEQIQFHKSSYENLVSPVKKIKITNDVVERGGVPADYSKRVISKDVQNANYSLREKYEKANDQMKNHKFGYRHGGKKYKSRNYYDSFNKN